MLFADLKGSLELIADRDPEEARRLLDPVVEHMCEAVEKYGGTVSQVMGDGILALFGAPVSWEDHAVRACYAALSMQDLVRHYGDDIQRAYGVPVQIRIGLNSGEVVVGSVGSDLHMVYTAVGQTVYLAARMEQMAKPASILATGPTLALAGARVTTRPLGPVPVRGLAEPVEVHEVVGAARIRSRLESPDSRPQTVRRPRPGARAARVLDAAHRRGRLVALVGEAGTVSYCPGFRARAARRAACARDRRVSYGAPSPTARASMSRRYFAVDDGDGPGDPRQGERSPRPRPRARGRDPAIMLGAARGQRLSRWTAAAAPRHRAPRGGREARRRPVVLVVEDLH